MIMDGHELHPSVTEVSEVVAIITRSTASIWLSIATGNLDRVLWTGPWTGLWTRSTDDHYHTITDLSRVSECVCVCVQTEFQRILVSGGGRGGEGVIKKYKT